MKVDCYKQVQVLMFTDHTLAPVLCQRPDQYEDFVLEKEPFHQRTVSLPLQGLPCRRWDCPSSKYGKAAIALIAEGFALMRVNESRPGSYVKAP